MQKFLGVLGGFPWFLPKDRNGRSGLVALVALKRCDLQNVSVCDLVAIAS